MLPKTDLKKIKEQAKLFLMFDLKPVENYPFIVKHPFTDSTYTVDQATGTFVNLLEDDTALERWRTQIAKQIESADNVHCFSMMLTKSYRSAFLKYTTEYMDVKDFSEALADYWVSTESPNSDPNFSKKQLVRMFSQAGKQYLMAQRNTNSICLSPKR